MGLVALEFGVQKVVDDESGVLAADAAQCERVEHQGAELVDADLFFHRPRSCASAIRRVNVSCARPRTASRL